VSVDPAQGGQFDVLDGAPSARPGGAADEFGLVIAVARLDRRAISMASYTISVRMWLATRQPTIIRENTSMMKLTQATPAPNAVSQSYRD
jgi:hypothetical protein